MSVRPSVDRQPLEPVRPAPARGADTAAAAPARAAKGLVANPGVDPVLQEAINVKQDAVTLSQAARLAQSSAGEAPLEAEHLATLRNRVKSGFYDQPEVIDHIIGRLIDGPEIALPVTGGRQTQEKSSK